MCESLYRFNHKFYSNSVRSKIRIDIFNKIIISNICKESIFYPRAIECSKLLSGSVCRLTIGRKIME